MCERCLPKPFHLLHRRAIATAWKVFSCPARTCTPAGSIKFIDYEYAGYNYQAFDIGNHFNEFAGLNEVDYSYYPERSVQLLWLRSYLEAYKELKGLGSEVSDREVKTLYVQVNQFALASHFFWGLWALIQAKFSTIDFDFLGYAVLRFNQYFKMKPEAAALSLPKKKKPHLLIISLGFCATTPRQQQSAPFRALTRRPLLSWTSFFIQRL
ncbi:hypothetical protein OJAV_G00219920 [Oryzias javanicus]|uniref:ethanolamine kinase n=1 Tax=Oryzias javanicus TaxID=123683 RepID=A0A3S2MCU5_ORYJA|nr:hypothetical protein OJAV_G00219920 [Oryzias javanicus]